jgi:hypothetical protein
VVQMLDGDKFRAQKSISGLTWRTG